MTTIEVQVDIGEKIKKIVHHGANMTHGGGKPEEQTLSVQMIHIIAGSPINRNKKTIRYTCFNETTGKFEELSDTEMEELCNQS